MQSIFSRNKYVEKTAFLNWRISGATEIGNLLNLADGFLLSAIELAKHCLENNEDKRADILIFPILTNANHGIELYLKCLNWILNGLMNLDKKIEGRHNIKQIFQTVNAKYKSYSGNISYKEFKEASQGLENYIEELFKKIKATSQKDKMDFSRYTFDNDYENHFYVDVPENVMVDLENFVKRFETIKQKMENLTDFMYYHELLHEW